MPNATPNTAQTRQEVKQRNKERNWAEAEGPDGDWEMAPASTEEVNHG